MSALTETPPRPPLPVQKQAGGLRLHGKAGGYWVGFLIAVGIHGGLLFFWPHSKGPDQQVEFAVEAGDASVEVTLVAALPAEDNAPPVEQPPDPTPQPPPPPEPTPEPPPPPPEKPAEMTMPEPPPKPPEPEQKREPAPKPHPPKAQPKPHTEAPTHRAVGDGSSAIPGNDATTAKAASGASSKPGYLRNPHPAYPEEARAARQQGVVSLHVNVDASGHVASVRVAHSSGFPILDERARSTVAERWAFKPASTGGVPVASEVVIPIRFTLDH